MNFTYETDRLLLKALGPEDVDCILDFYQKNLPYFLQFESPVSENFLAKDFQAELLRAEKKLSMLQREFRYWVFLKEDPSSVIGTVSFRRIRTAPFLDCELGYKLDPDFQHLGYTHEAVSFLLSEVFSDLSLHRVIALVQPDNAPSVRLLERLGFTPEGQLRKSSFINGNWHDTALYGLLAEDVGSFSVD